jgi:hypothetical protein
MQYGLVGLYSLYLIFVGLNGNASKLFDETQKDVRSFAPWLLSIIILKALYEVPTLRPAVGPFVGLALLTFVLRNYDNVASEVQTITGINLEASK